MGVQRRKLCCICSLTGPSTTDKKALSKWRKSTSYERDFGCCFGAGAENRSGDLCPTCRTLVAQKYRNNRDLSFSYILDSKARRSAGRPIVTVLGHSYAANISTTQVTQHVHDDDDQEIFILEPAVVDATQPTENQLLISPTKLENLRHVDISTHSALSTENLHVPQIPATNHGKTVRKRLRDEVLPVSVRLQRPRQEMHIATNLPSVLFNGPAIDFLGHMLPGKIVSNIMNFLSETDCLMVTVSFIIPSLQNSVKQITQTVKTEREKYDRLKNISKYGPLSQPQKCILQDLIINRDNNLDKDKCIVIPRVGSGGKSKRYLKVPKVQLSSANASKRTKNIRSQIVEQVEKICSSPDVSNLHVHDQRVNNIKRDKDGYAAAAEDAGLKIVARFNKKTVLSLRSIMTLRMWRVLKKVFNQEVGWDVFGSVESMQKQLKTMEFEYECGTVTSSTGEVVHFVRVKDINAVVHQLVSELYKAKELIYLDNLNENCLWLHLSADKGGKSTKLILQIINQKDRHSIDFAKLIGYFEGKDNRVNMEEIFCPIFDDLKKCSANISKLTLLRPPNPPSTCSQPNQACRKHSNCDETIRWTPLVPFDQNNTTISTNCKHCKKCHPASRKIDPYEPNEQLDRIPVDDVPHTPASTYLAQPAVDNSFQTSPNHQDGKPTQGSETPTCTPPCSLPDMLTPHRGLRNDCPQPRNLFAAAKKDTTQLTGEPASTGIYTDCRVTVGGDWEGTSKLIGLSGPNGKYFCNHCLVILSDVKPGVPHAVHILPKYQCHTDDRAFVLPIDIDFMRTFERCEDMHNKFLAAGNKAKAQNFENCPNRPLFSGGAVVDTFSTTPLHVSLGLGLHFLNVIEGEAIKLDKEIKDSEGQYDAFSTVFERKKEILLHCQGIRNKLDSVDDKISQVIEKKKEVIKDRATFFRKDQRGKYVHNSELAKGVRRHLATLDNEKAALLKEKEKHEIKLKTQESKLTKVMEDLLKLKGPFKNRLDNFLDSLKLKRAAYHSNALIGPDVKKLVTKSNIPKFGEVFKPLKLQKRDGTFHVFGTHNLRCKIVTLLTKFMHCYDLYTANHPLCRHEVELLAMRCSSLGCWFPVNFKKENLKRKFHLLTVDVPKQARRMRTVGMITEQTIESIHPYINELDRRFAKVADPRQKGIIICKQQNMYSQPNWNAVKKRKVKK